MLLRLTRTFILLTIFLSVVPAYSVNVRVRLKSFQNHLLISGRDIRIGASGIEPVSVGVVSDYDLALVADSLGEKKWRVKDQIRKTEREIYDSQIDVRGQSVLINGQLAPQSLRVVGEAGNRISVVATFDLESYLAGVLPSEMPRFWPLEVLKAQAIASRTFAIRRTLERRQAEFDVEANVLDQVFEFARMSREHNDDSVLKRAIVETRGLVLRDAEGRIAEAYYHADCGGSTERAEDVWGNGRSAFKTLDQHCELVHKDWQYRISFEDLAHAFGLRGPFGDESPILSAIELTDSGRIKVLSLQWGTLQRELSGQQLREKLGYDHIKSTLLSWQLQNRSVIFTGRGYGHGVGMCQRGAHQLARQGLNNKQILRHYYGPAIQIVEYR